MVKNLHSLFSSVFYGWWMVLVGCSMRMLVLLLIFMESIFPVGWATVGDFFGRKSFATIRGTMSFFYLWGPALGPVITGAVYDRYQSYAPLMSVYIATSLIASALYAGMRKPQLR